MRSVKISIFSFTILSFIMIPWTKQEFRIGPVPAAYVPVVVVMILTLIATSIRSFSKFKLYENNVALSNWLILLILFISISAILSTEKISAMIYAMQWFLYILIMIYVSNIRVNRKKLENSLISIISFISMGCIMGLIRFFIFHYPDANPILILNRNASIFFIFPWIPVCFSLKEKMKLKTYIVNMFVLNSTIIFVFARTGYIVLLLAYLMLFMKKDTISNLNYNIVKVIKVFMLTLLVLVLLNVIAPTVVELVKTRSQQLFETLRQLFSKNVVDYDSRRVLLLDASKRIIKTNFWFGTGIGTGNYLRFFPNDIATVPARAHNLYYSYFGEFGIFGFITLLGFLFTNVLTQKRVCNKERDNLTRGFFIGNVMILVAFSLNEYITSPMVWLYWGLGLLSMNTIERNE